MIDRIIEIANPARLSVRDAQLVIERPQAEQLIATLHYSHQRDRCSAAGPPADHTFASGALAHR